jgi:formylglycine-generating enzyme required for sulfatase activity
MIYRSLLLVSILGVGCGLAWGAETKTERKSWRNTNDGMEFVWIPPGNLAVEATWLAGKGQALMTTMTFPQGYWMGRTEVTLGQYRRFVAQTGHVTEAEKAKNRWSWKNPGFPQTEMHPVAWLGFGDAVRYVQWAGVDVPTEAEWLHACRAGTFTKFYWGDEIDDRYLWHRGNSGDGTRPVAQKLPSTWGLYDMIGNAHEWCRSGEYGVLRGGSWTRCPKYLHVSGRVVEPFDWEVGLRLHDGSKPLMYPWDDDRGFRCIKRTGPRIGDPPVERSDQAVGQATSRSQLNGANQARTRL